MGAVRQSTEWNCFSMEITAGGHFLSHSPRWFDELEGPEKSQVTAHVCIAPDETRAPEERRSLRSVSACLSHSLVSLLRVFSQAPLSCELSQHGCARSGSVECSNGGIDTKYPNEVHQELFTLNDCFTLVGRIAEAPIRRTLWHRSHASSVGGGFSGDLGSVTLLVFRTRAVNYVNVASTALLAYDFLLTLGDEIRLMWSARWNASKLLFFATRYPVFIHCSLDLAMYLSPSMSSNMCAPVYKAVGWLSIIAIMTAELILFMRTYAIYGRSRSILIFFAIIAVGLGIPAVILLNLSLNSVKFLPKSPLTTLAPCVPYSADRIVFLDFYFLMAFELVVVVLTAWKGVYKWRENRGPLIVTFVKDGVFYFLTLFASSLANAVVMMDAPLAYFGLMLQVQRVLHAMLSARVLLHIRATVDQDEAFSWPNPATLSWAPNREFMTTTVTNNVTTNFTSDIELTSSQSTSRPDYP